MDSATRIRLGEEELSAATREGRIELFFPGPDSVLRVNVSLRLAVALSFWIIRHWVFNCWFGLKLRWRDRQTRRQIFGTDREFAPVDSQEP